jgi:predicted MFS family arabinose efflux permease
MVWHLNALFLYPEALGVLALSKVYSVAKTALVPGLVHDSDDLVHANARLSRVSAIGGAAGAALGAGVTRLAGAPPVLVLAAALFGAAALTATHLPRPLAGVAVSRALEYEEVHAPAPMMAASAQALLRFGIGFLTFLLAFALRDAGEPPWFFGVAIVAAGAGAFAGTYAASRLRRVLHEEQMLALALVVPAVFILAAGVQVGRPSVLGAALVLGLGASVGRQAFDSLIQHKAPDATRGHLMARFETGFQLAWAAGALIPVAFRPRPWVGLLALACVFIAGSAAYIMGARSILRLEAEAIPARRWVHRWLETSDRPAVEAVILLDAEEHAALGNHRVAIIGAATACEIVIARTLASTRAAHTRPAGRSAESTDDPDDALRTDAEACRPMTDDQMWLYWSELQQARRHAIAADEELSSKDSDHAIALAGRVAEQLSPSPALPDGSESARSLH